MEKRKETMLSDVVYDRDDGTNVCGRKGDEPEPMLLACIALDPLSWRSRLRQNVPASQKDHRFKRACLSSPGSNTAGQYGGGQQHSSGVFYRDTLTTR